MKIRVWTPAMSVEETKDLAYWERNALALFYAQGWYYDDVENHGQFASGEFRGPRYPGWRRVLSLEGGNMTFHIPDDFDVGDLPQIEPNWDGHTTEEKWRTALAARGVCAHRFVTKRQGGSPDTAEAYELVRYCDNCGAEDDAE